MEGGSSGSREARKTARGAGTTARGNDKRTSKIGGDMNQRNENLSHGSRDKRNEDFGYDGNRAVYGTGLDYDDFESGRDQRWVSPNFFRPIFEMCMS